VPDGARSVAYLDRLLDVGEGRELLAPMTFARLVQALAIRPRDRVLDIACGLGYSTAVLARLAESVTGVESKPVLAQEAAARLAAAGVANAAVVAGPLSEPPAKGPYDAIMVNGAVESVPALWIAALGQGGRLAYVRGAGRSACAVLIARSGSGTSERVLFDAAAPVLAELRKKTEFAF
jgi:protein-L-isoaspartate(D-aspartate) O-methyltransferase